MFEKNIDRRRHPRGPGDVEYLFAVQVEDIVSETKDISVGGLMCKVNRYFKPKTVLTVTFILPLYSGRRVNFDKIHCKARVMRCDPYPEIDDPDCHNLGLEFVSLKPDQKIKIAKFVRHTAGPKTTLRKGPISVKISPRKG